MNHQANLIKAFFGDGEQWKVAIDYSLESKPLSTIAPLCLIPDLPETFLLMNGDVLTDLSFRTLVPGARRERQRRSPSRRSSGPSTIDYGVLADRRRTALIGFEEKPSMQYLVSMGVYVVERSVLDARSGRSRPTASTI